MKQIEFIKTVARALGDFNEKAVFVGGATVPFYLPEEFKLLSRPTEDVDVVIELLNPRIGKRWKQDFEFSERSRF